MTKPPPFPADAEIDWPERFRPGTAPVHVRNAMWMNAPADTVWAWLVREPLWPTWYPNATNNWSKPGALHQDLQSGSLFYWRTFGVTVTSQVAEFLPGQRIAWTARGMGLDAYHAWLLIPAGGGCWVLTEESQYGWGARLLNFLLPGRMSRGHKLWLKSLAIESCKGMPPEL